MKKLLLALALFLAPATAFAQCNGVFPNNTLCGNTTGGSNTPRPVPATSIPGLGLIVGTTSITGGVNGRIIYDNVGVIGELSSIANSYLAPGAANTLKGSLNGTVTSDIPVPACATSLRWTSGTGFICAPSSSSTPIFSTRTAAAAIDLSSFSAIQTLGYSTAGDGGAATYINIGSAPFIDSFVTNVSIAGGSGYTNGSYFGILWQTGTKPFVIGTATVSGGVVTAVNNQFTPGNQCHVGDIYTTSSIPGGTGASLTVTGCSTPLGSFTDTAGNHWQLQSNSTDLNVLQFGCKGDWNGNDGSATDNWNCIQAASWFAAFKSSQSQDAGGWWGNRVWFPQGSYMVLGNGSTPLVVPIGVTWEGASSKASNVVWATAFSILSQALFLCDPDWHFACFDSNVRHISLSTRNSAPAGGNHVYMVFSNNAQDFSGVDDVYIYASGRGCLWYTDGYGGASSFTINKMSCNANSTLPMLQLGDTVGSGDNLGSTAVAVNQPVFGGPSSGGTYQTGPCVLLLGGFVSIRDGHCEEAPIGVQINTPNAGNNNIHSIDNFNAGSGSPAPACTGAVQLDGTNAAGNVLISRISSGSCTNTITNNQSGGTSSTGSITKPVTCVSGSCS